MRRMSISMPGFSSALSGWLRQAIETGANKAQVQEMVKRLLKLPGLPGKDAADALGLAISHAHAATSLALATQQRRSHALYRRGRVY